MLFSRVEHVLILKHYFGSESFVAVRKAIGNAYPVKEVQSETII
jgi:hypothetical protein